jgi:uncharacterized membrane protein YedE/YeeE
MNPILLGALTGAAFGAVLAASGLSNPRLIVGMLRLEDLRLLKLLVTAIGVGIVGVAVLDSMGAAHLGVKPLHVIALVAGGAIFGIGFAVSGYCPGTSLAAIAEGRRDAIFTAAGGLLGAGAFAFAYDTLRPFLIEPLSFGSPTLHSWLGVPGLAVALPVGAVAGCVIVLWLRPGRRSRRPSAGARGSLSTSARRQG